MLNALIRVGQNPSTIVFSGRRRLSEQPMANDARKGMSLSPGAFAHSAEALRFAWMTEEIARKGERSSHV